MHGKRLLRVALGEAVNFIDAQRVALLGDKQALADRIVGQALKTLVAIEPQAQRQLLGLIGMQFVSPVLAAAGRSQLTAATGLNRKFPRPAPVFAPACLEVATRHLVEPVWLPLMWPA
jgi:hypothetical protein